MLWGLKEPVKQSQYMFSSLEVLSVIKRNIWNLEILFIIVDMNVRKNICNIFLNLLFLFISPLKRPLFSYIVLD